MRWLRWVLLPTSGVILPVVAVWYAAVTPHLTIRDIHLLVSHTNIPHTSIKDHLNRYIGMNPLLISCNTIRHDLESIPIVSSARVSVKKFSVIEASVTLRLPVACLRDGHRCWGVDTEGRGFLLSGSPPLQIPELIWNNRKDSEIAQVDGSPEQRMIFQIAALVTHLPALKTAKVQILENVCSGEIKLYPINKRFCLRLSAWDAPDRLEQFDRWLEANGDVLSHKEWDLRFPDILIVRPFKEEVRYG